MADAEFHPAVDPTTIQINGAVVDDDRTAEAEGLDASITENVELKEEMKRLVEQIHKLEKDVKAKEAEKNQVEAAAEEDKKALEAVSARAIELETELFRLQHDYFAATSEREDLLGKLQRRELAVKEAERAKMETDSRMTILKQDAERIGADFGRRIRELEEEVKGKDLEVQRAKNDRAAAEERLKRLDEKREGLEKSAEEFKLKNLEMEKAMVSWRKEKLELEEKVVILQRELEKEEEGNDKKEKCLSGFAWGGGDGRTMLAATKTAAAVASVGAAAALFYLKYAKQGKGRD